MSRSGTRPAIVGIALALATPLTAANDRPFLLTSTAAAEEDDDGVWAAATWWRGAAAARSVSASLEYAFDPTNSVEAEFARARGSGQSVSAAELEFKHLFNHIGRDGWGWGVVGSLQAERPGGAEWKAQSLPIKLLYTLPLFDSDGLLHLNGGIQFQRGEPREWIGSAAFEYRLPWRSVAFVEWGREDRSTLVQAGLRHWVKRERFAVDLSFEMLGQDGARSRGVVLGLAFYDF